jgi:hypothetical protein
MLQHGDTLKKLVTDFTSTSKQADWHSIYEAQQNILVLISQQTIDCAHFLTDYAKDISFCGFCFDDMDKYLFFWIGRDSYWEALSVTS